MLIELPPEINNKTFVALANLAYERSFSEPHCLFDWTKTEWVGLPEVVRILNWSAKLAARGTKVQWAIWEPHKSSDRLDALRPLAAEVLGSELFRKVTNKIEKLDRQTQDGVLSTSEFTAQQNSIYQTVTTGQGYSREFLHKWLALEMQRFRRLEVLTYLQRYKLIANAIAAGVQVDPVGRNIPRYKLAPKPDSACLPLEPIQSKIEVRGLVDRLNDPSELARILGDYAGLDVARGGALAGIVVTELGGNIEDHARASAAWICTRLVLDINVARQTVHDPSTTSFRARGKGFLEIIVCDNGCGLTENLRTVLLRDKRISVSNKYSSQALPSEVQLIDYAFDRLSSTKRDISQLINLEESPQQSNSTTRSFVSSGLYWVWNVVRSHRGVLSLETGGFRTWYDFTAEATETYGWRLIYPKFEKSTGLRCGTLIRICLPLAENDSHKERENPIHSESDLVSKSTSSQKFFFTWVGELTTSVPLKPRKAATDRREVGMERLPGISDDHSMRLLQELHQKHLVLGDGDVLILDLCGVRTEWAKHSIVPLCHFVLEMNYTSTVGRSAVVFWNVPASSMQIFELAIRLRDLFEKNLENANRKHSQLREFRRAVLMVFDDEQIRIFCGWKEAEDILSRLSQDADLDLDEIGAARLSDRDNERLKKLITENSHLFEWKGNNRVQLRIWPRGIRIAAWREGLAWLRLLLERDVLDQGVRLRASGYFRLPSTGQLVKVFYQFRGLLADHEACAKLAWLIAQVVSALEARRIDTPKPALHLISVSRSTMSLACHLRDNYYYDSRSGVSSVLAERTIEELEAAGGNSALKGDAILITDVLSSGHLCDRIARAFPGVTWISTIALLDTRDVTPEKTVQLQNGIDVFEGPNSATGTIYALALKKVQKLSPAEVGDAQIQAIDEVNVCAVETFEERSNTEGKFWEFADRKPDALKVGHYVGNNHHYIYKVDVGELLTAPNEEGQTLMSVIVHRVESDLRKKHYSPDNTVIMHPPHDHSHAEKIARAVQLNTGVLYRHILYKDNFAGHWRFSAFVHHGVPLKRSTLVLIDDGTNSGETIMGLLDAATFGNPHDVLAYVGVTRMPPHKNHLFTSLKNLRSITGNVKVQFFLELSIPVYAPRECPICRLITTLAEIAENNPLIRRYAQILRSQLLPRTSHDNGHLPFLWRFSSEQTVTKLREDLETLDYHVPASSHVYSELERAVHVNNREAAKENLLDLAFIVCSEPDWASATVFAPYLDSRERGLVEASLKCVRESAENNLMTFLGFAYHLLLRSHQRMPTQDFTPDLAKFWRSLFSRSDITTEVFGKIIAFILAEAAKEKLTEPEKPKFGHKLLHELKAQVNPRSISVDRLNHRAISKAFAYLFVREALTPSRELRMRGFVDANVERPDLFDLAKKVASKFWWHSSDYIKTNINLLRDAVVADTPSTQDRLYGPIHSLIVSFDDLYELKERMEEADRKSREETGEILGTQIYWETPELNDAIAKFMRSLVEITEESGVGLAEFEPQTSLFVLEQLSSTWDQLTSHLGLAFEELFPEVQAVIERIWGDFANLTDLPESIAQPLHIGASVSRTHRVFMPRTLLFKFLDAALNNLRTSAFSGWTIEDLLKKAQARIELEFINELTEKTIILRVIDNGPTELHEPRAGQGRGLKNVRLMARHFAAQVIGPEERNGETYVELRMKSRESGDRE